MLMDLYGAVKKWARILQEKQDIEERRKSGQMSKRADSVELEIDDA